MLLKQKLLSILLLVLINSSCAEVNECNQRLLNAYWDISKYESEMDIVGEVPAKLRDNLSNILKECREQENRFIVQENEILDNNLILISYLDLAIIASDYHLFRFFLKNEDRTTWPAMALHFNTNKSSLHIAATYGDTRFIKDILSTGVKVDIKDDYGTTPLMSALNNFDNFVYLMENNANPLLSNKSGYSAVCLIELAGIKKTSAYLLKKGLKCQDSRLD